MNAINNKSLPLAPRENAEDMPLHKLKDMSDRGKFDICDVVRVVNNENESLKSFDAFYMDYLDSVLEDKSKLEVLEMAFGGRGFDPTHELFRIDDNNKLDSFETEKEYRKFLNDNLWKIVVEADKIPTVKFPEEYVSCRKVAFHDKTRGNTKLKTHIIKEDRGRD